MATSTRLPKLKYCGLTRTADVVAAIASGADAIGLNFYPQSPRYVAPMTARGLMQIIHSSRADGRIVLCVGVFVNASPADVDAILSACPLDCIQLHGDETPDWLEESKAFPSMQSISFIKAVAWRDCDEDRARAMAWNFVRDDRFLGFLVDAHDPAQRGGTGKTTRWDLLFPRPKELRSMPVMLAGGLTPENIGEAIETAKPDGVDVASGIEISPGLKDHLKMRAMGDIARQLLLDRA